MTTSKYIKKSFTKLSTTLSFTINIKRMSKITEISGKYFRYVFWVYLGNDIIKKDEVWAHNIDEVKKVIENKLKRIYYYN
ncbi:MAG: hypothetical protein ABIB46_06255 [bacterium]